MNKRKRKKSLARPPGSLGQNFVVVLLLRDISKRKKVFSECVRLSISGVSLQMKPFTVAYLLRDWS